MGDIYPLWAAGSLSDEERASLRERVESAPAHPPEPQVKSKTAPEELRELSEVLVYTTLRMIEDLPAFADPRVFASLDRLRKAMTQPDEGLLRVEKEALVVVAERVYRLLPFLLRYPLRQTPLREAGPLTPHAAALLAAIARARRDGYLPDDDNLQERCEILVVSARSRDSENLAFALEAVEDRLVELISGDSGPGDLPPAAEARLAVPRPALPRQRGQ